jgi:hypothetical protein
MKLIKENWIKYSWDGFRNIFLRVFSMSISDNNTRTRVFLVFGNLPHMSIPPMYQRQIISDTDSSVLDGEYRHQRTLCMWMESSSVKQRWFSVLTYWQSWALLEKLPIVLPLKNFTAFYGTRRFITVFTRAFHWSLSWGSSIQSTPHHPISLKIHFNIVHPPTSWSF